MENSSEKSIIEDLLEKPFSKRTFSEKRLIIQNGRPCPNLSSLKTLHKDSTREYTRRFKDNQYTLYTWMAGCENKLKLFCWPCLLFSRIRTSWNSTGVDNLKTLQTLQKKHKISTSHLQSVLKLANFGGTRIDESLSSQTQFLNSQHNLKVKKNREVLKRLIDVTCFLANQELPFRGQDESSSSLNRGNYIELLNLLKEYDETLEQHFETETDFKITSMSIQNDLTIAVSELLHSHICEQIKASTFVAIMLDETSDTQMKSQLSVVLRYYFQNRIYETFVGFIDVGSGRTADELFQVVENILRKYSIKEKLVAQTYDGAAAMSEHVKGLQMKIKSLCPKAIFVHCYAHVLNLVLSQGFNNIPECKIFFSTLNGISKFASHSSNALKEYLKQIIPSLDITRWCFSSQLVNVVHTYRETILEYFESVKTDENCTWEPNDRIAASGYVNFLESFETVFLLNIFSKIFTQSDVLFNSLQNENVDIVYCVTQIKEFEEFLKTQREQGFWEVWETTSNTVTYHEERRKIRKDEFDSNETKHENMFYEIVDNLEMQIMERLSSFEQLKHFDLLNEKKFNEFKNKFPDELIDNLIQSYPGICDKTALKNELTVLYASGEKLQCHIAKTEPFQPSGPQKIITPYDVLLWIESKNISGTFEQVYRLSKLICTVPPITGSEEQSFSCLKRIKTYLRSTHGQERLSNLALLSVEKELLKKLRKEKDFHDRVIQIFLTVEPRMDFIYII